jgi:hypothetical protein
MTISFTFSQEILEQRISGMRLSVARCTVFHKLNLYVIKLEQSFFTAIAWPSAV